MSFISQRVIPSPMKAILKTLAFNFVILFLLLIYPLHSYAEPPEIHCKHFIYGCPMGTPPTNDLIIRE
jgi:hypothetical protein